MSNPHRVVIADDHPPTRAGVRAAIENEGFLVCAEVADASAAIAAAREHRPDLCLLDVHMPGGGVAAAAAISSEFPDVAIVMLTVSRNDEDILGALKAGASGYLLKDTDPKRLPHALGGVLRGEAALPRTLVARVIEEFRGRSNRRGLFRARGVNLTSREWEVLELLRQGLTTKEIAERLFISRGTVRTHVAAILKKLRAPDRQAAIALLEESQ